MIGMIAAVSSNGVIGIDNQLPFSYKEDLSHFKKTTSGDVIIMGRNTFESIGKTLPNRTNIVVSKSMNLDRSDLIIKPSLEEAVNTAKSYNKTIWLIGGASIYEKGMELADKIILTVTPDIITNKNNIKFPWINPMWFTQEKIEVLDEDKNLFIITYIKKN